MFKVSPSVTLLVKLITSVLPATNTASSKVSKKRLPIRDLTLSLAYTFVELIIKVINAINKKTIFLIKIPPFNKFYSNKNSLEW